MRIHEVLSLSVAALALFPGIAEAGSLQHMLEANTGIHLTDGPDHSLFGKIGSCNFVVQDQHAEGYKVFSFAGDNSELSPTGLSEHDIAELKANMGDAHMTTDQLLSHFEHTKQPMVLKYIEALKNSCALTS
jgi:hypothetical protein